VLTVIGYRDEDEAVRLANASRYGLGGTVWTTNEARGQAVARRVRTGTFGINRYAIDPSAPFGGVKDSGLGRELGPEAIHDFQHTKTIYA
jgi:aldehyde dehydrogenase (NAD+)